MQSNAHLPRDLDGGYIQVLAADDTTVQSGTIGVSAVLVILPNNTDIAEITLDADVYIKFGDSSVVADTLSRVLMRGTHTYSMRKEQTHISILQLSGADTGPYSVCKLV